MFSLIITIVSIALVALLCLAVVYYGGDSMRKSSSITGAATLIAQAQQIAGAGALVESTGGSWPVGAPQFSAPVLTQMPVPPQSAYVSGISSSNDWEYYVPTAHHFVLKNKIKKDVCMEVNRKFGLNGIPAAWTGTDLVQCFGPAEPYTFFYDPPSSTAAENNTVLAASVSTAQVITPAATAGYPRLCADNTIISTGVCPSSTPGGGAGSNASPTPPSEGASISDTFTGSEQLAAHVSDSGAVWENHPSMATSNTTDGRNAYVLNGTEVLPKASRNSSVTYWDRVYAGGTGGFANGYVMAQFNRIAETSTTPYVSLALFMRQDPSDSYRYYAVTMNLSKTQTEIIYGTGDNDLATANIGPLSGTFTVRTELVGDVAKVFVNGTKVLEYTDTQPAFMKITAPGKVGFGLADGYSPLGNKLRMSSFQSGSL